MRFELTVPCGTSAFQAETLNHSATSPTFQTFSSCAVAKFSTFFLKQSTIIYCLFSAVFLKTQKSRGDIFGDILQINPSNSSKLSGKRAFQNLFHAANALKTHFPTGRFV